MTAGGSAETCPVPDNHAAISEESHFGDCILCIFATHVRWLISDPDLSELPSCNGQGVAASLTMTLNTPCTRC